MKRDPLFPLVLLFAVYDVYFSASEPVPRNQCSRTYLGRLGSGVIASYNYPFDYRDNLTCVYRIYLNDRANVSHTVCLTFHRFSLENSSPFCSFDYVELGSSPPMKYCGNGLWQYGVEKKGNLFSNIWSPNLCWSVQKSDTFDLVFSSDNSINGTGFYATFQVYSASFARSFLPSGASDLGPCRATDWTCFNRKCIAVKLLCNGQNDCGDWSDESYAHARCKGQNILACDFSDESREGGFCGFDHEGWFRSSELKKSNRPFGDHTNGSRGYYIYSDGSSYLVSPQLSLFANTTHCLSFWYFVYGATPSMSLSLYITREQAYSRPEWMHHISGTAFSDKWSLGEVTIYTGAALQVIFSSQPLNNETGIALDDISITQGSCSGADISCNFESGLCGWESPSQLNHSSGTWTADKSWQIQSKELGSLGPNSDHSSYDGSGSYLYTEFLVPIVPSSQAILISPPISTTSNEETRCLQFWYYTGKHVPSSCRLSVLLHRYDNVLSGEIWSQAPSGDDTWKQANVEFEANRPLQIVLLASVRSGKTDTDCEIALDQLRVVSGRCTDEDGAVCDTGQYQCSSGHCIASHLVCDQVSHCRDGSDEDWRAGCFSMVESQPTSHTNSITCPPATSFLCHSSSFCIPRAWLCDLFNDCGDMSDEGPLAGCPDDLLVPHPSTFGAEMNFTMDAAMVLPSTRVTSNLITPNCEFSCADGFCVSTSQKCDGVQDCTNGQDEINCSDVYVPPLTFCQQPSLLCLNENRCLSSKFICDGKDDCLDGSDEAVSVCSDKLSYGAVTGIIFGCCFSILFLFLVALIARQRRKSCSVRQPHHSNRNPTHISTVFSVNNQGGISHRIDALSAFVARNGDSERSRDRNRDNMGYIEEGNRDVSGMVFPSEMQLMFGDAPPSYNSVLHDDGQLVERRRTLVRGNSADEVEVPMSGAGTPDDSETAQVYDPPVGHSRNRRSYRSLPPTPARQPLVSHLQTSNDQQPAGHRRSVLGYGAVSGHDDHAYEDPSSAMQRRASRSGSQLSGCPQMVNVPSDVFHHSSVISPTLSSHRASRIRLGTTALQTRPGMVHGHVICGPVCTWHSDLVPDAVNPHSHRQLCYDDRASEELGNYENDDPGYNVTLNEFMLPDEDNHFMHEPNSHRRPNNRIIHNSNSSCLSSEARRDHSNIVCHRADPDHTRTSRCNRSSVESTGDYPDFVWNGFGTESKSMLPVQHREHCYPVAGDARHPAGFVNSNHQRSFSSNGFQDHLLSNGPVASYLPNCDDRDFSSPTCV